MWFSGYFWCFLSIFYGMAMFWSECSVRFQNNHKWLRNRHKMEGLTLVYFEGVNPGDSNVTWLIFSCKKSVVTGAIKQDWNTLRIIPKVWVSMWDTPGIINQNFHVHRLSQGHWLRGLGLFHERQERQTFHVSYGFEQQNEGKLPRAWRHIAPTHTHMYA